MKVSDFDIGYRALFAGKVWEVIQKTDVEVPENPVPPTLDLPIVLTAAKVSRIIFEGQDYIHWSVDGENEIFRDTLSDDEIQLRRDDLAYAGSSGWIPLHPERVKKIVRYTLSLQEAIQHAFDGKVISRQPRSGTPLSFKFAGGSFLVKTPIELVGDTWKIDPSFPTEGDRKAKWRVEP